jgi:hypothetical protein
MSWQLPRYPANDPESICRYWHDIADIPLDEPGAEMLRQMAQNRLRELESTCRWPECDTV